MHNVITGYIPRESVAVNGVIGAYIHVPVMLEGACPPAEPAPHPPPDIRPVAAKPYHHGDLRRVLMDAALQLVERGRPRPRVREAARRAAVSPGAPFRHFPNRDALMAAVAEEAQAALSRRDRGALGRHRPVIRSLASVRWALPICAGRCATPPISRSSPRGVISLMECTEA